MYKKIAKDLNNNQYKYALYIIASVALLIFLLVAFKHRPSDNKQNNNAWRINVINADKTNVSPEIELYGTIINPFISRLKSTTETYVDEVYIREGQYAEKDESLVVLDSSEIELEVNLKKAIVDEITAKLNLEKEKYESDKKTLEAEKRQVELIEKNLNRQQALRKKKLNAQITLDQAAIELQKIKIVFYQRTLEVDSFKHKIAELEAKLLQTKSDFAKAQLDLERTNVKAPFNGYISKLFVSPGTRIQTNETILEIFNQDTIEVKVQVSQNTMSNLRGSIKSKNDINAKTTIFNETYELKFRNITANQNVRSGGTDAFFEFKDEERKRNIKTIGKTVAVILTLPEIKDVYVIPSVSVHHSDRIYIAKENKLKSLPISIKGSIKKNGTDYIIVASDNLNPGDKILSSVLPSAIDGLAVEIID